MDEEEILSSRFSNAIKSLGEGFSGDEKLFRFTGPSGYVRKVPNKPAKVGLWHYQGVVQLKSGLPYLLCTKMHNVLKKDFSSVKCHTVMCD